MNSIRRLEGKREHFALIICSTWCNNNIFCHLFQIDLVEDIPIQEDEDMDDVTIIESVS